MKQIVHLLFISLIIYLLDMIVKLKKLTFFCLIFSFLLCFLCFELKIYRNYEIFKVKIDKKLIKGISFVIKYFR